MLSKDKLEELSWKYLLFRSLDTGIAYNVLTYEHLCAHACTLFPEGKLTLHNVSTAELRDFCRSLAEAVNAVPGPFGVKSLCMEQELRNRIAYLFNIEATKRERWWYGNADPTVVCDFEKIAGVPKEESEEFFNHLIQHMRSLHT